VGIFDQEAKQMTPEIYKSMSISIKNGLYDKTVDGVSGLERLRRTTKNAQEYDTLTSQEVSALLNELAARIQDQLEKS
jgi:hypothetical protein